MMLLGYRDRNVHELVCHEVARRAGHYARAGVEVEAVPGADHPEAALSAGLGGSLVEALRGQRRWRATLVHTLRPLFWIWTREPDAEIAVLAGHPEGSIVAAFTMKARCREDALSILRFPVGSDRRRLDALLSGAVDAAVLGATFAPATLSRMGLTPSLFLGEALRFPTVGLAVDTDRIDPGHPSVRSVVAAQRAAIEDIRRGDPVAVDATLSLLWDSSRADAQHMLRHYISPHYGPGPRAVRAAGMDALKWLTADLHAEVGTGTDFYAELR